MTKPVLLITCEHAGNSVPKEFSSLFQVHITELDSHLGWDPGAWEIAVSFAKSLGTTPHGCHTSRLLIEPNRSLHSSQLFSHVTRQLPKSQKQKLINNIYLPYRNLIEEKINKATGFVLHLSIHTFTPVFNNQIRAVDIGLLFDPGRHAEKTFCEAYAENISRAFPHLAVRFNEPYKGVDDGFTTYLRTRFDNGQYAGIEIEINQKFSTSVQDMAKGLAAALPQ